MFSASAELYDVIYGAFKDYRAEAAQVAGLVRSIRPGARTLLDVACGTGEHARFLVAEHGFEVVGLDLDPGLLAVARRKLPNISFHEGDLADFSIPRRFDAVTCLFSSIGYLRTLDRVTLALRRFRDHLAPDGVVVVEPWFAPGILRVGEPSMRTAEFGDLRIKRAGYVTVEGRLSRIAFEYQIEEPAGSRRVSEVHELGLFTPEEMLESFDAAGLAATHDPAGLTDRGLYVGRVASWELRPESRRL